MAAEETAATEEVKSVPQQAFDVTLSFVHKPSPAPAKGEGVKVMMIFVRSASNREAAAALDLLPLARAALRPAVQAVLRCRDARSPTGHAPRPSRQSLHQAFLCLLKVKQKGDMGRVLKKAMGEGSSNFYNPAENAGKKESKCACCSPPSARACVAARRRLSRTSLSRLAYVDLPYIIYVEARLTMSICGVRSTLPGPGVTLPKPGVTLPTGSVLLTPHIIMANLASIW